MKKADSDGRNVPGGLKRHETEKNGYETRRKKVKDSNKNADVNVVKQLQCAARDGGKGSTDGREGDFAAFLCAGEHSVEICHQS